MPDAAGASAKSVKKEYTMMNKILNTVNAPAAIGPYSQGVQCGNMVLCPASCPLCPLPARCWRAPWVK